MKAMSDFMTPIPETARKGRLQWILQAKIS